MTFSQLSEEQRMMRQSCRDFVDDVVIPFIRGNWQREWDMRPEARLPPEILGHEIDQRSNAIGEFLRVVAHLQGRPQPAQQFVGQNLQIAAFVLPAIIWRSMLHHFSSLQ
jgi:hypothetical protein